MSGLWGRTGYSRNSSLLDSPFRLIINSTPRWEELSNLRRTRILYSAFYCGLVASFARRGLKLVLLRVPLCSELATLRLAIQIRSRAIIESGMKIHPALSLGISNISW